VSLAPGQPTVAGATTTAAAVTTAGAAAGAASPYATIQLSLQVQGTYFNIEQFFNAVESLSRAMLVSGFTLSPAGEPSSGGAGSGVSALPPGTLNAQVTALVFESPQLTPSATTTGH
jgi:hypothetical protein